MKCNVNNANLTPNEARLLIRENKLAVPTSGFCKGHVQANMAILPKKEAFDFLLFTQRNPKPCPVLEVLDVGSFSPKFIAKNADVRTDIGGYRVYRKGVLTDELSDIKGLWQDDFVTFLIGCSFSFESALLNAGIPIRHMDNCHNVPMFITNIDCKEAGAFHGKMVVSMRPIRADQVVRAVTATSRFPAVHGAPVHIGDPALIGIKDIMKPDFGDASILNDGEIPVFWACGVTPQSVALSSKPDLMITHAPGYMFICDDKDEDYALF